MLFITRWVLLFCPKVSPKEVPIIPQLTEAQIQTARDIDLLSYLQTHAPHSIRKSGPNEYCLKAHDSLKISNGKWHWFSQGFGGHSALDYLIKVEGMGDGAVASSSLVSTPPKSELALLFETRFCIIAMTKKSERGIKMELMNIKNNVDVLYKEVSILIEQSRHTIYTQAKLFPCVNYACDTPAHGCRQPAGFWRG